MPITNSSQSELAPKKSIDISVGNVSNSCVPSALNQSRILNCNGPSGAQTGGTGYFIPYTAFTPSSMNPTAQQPGGIQQLGNQAPFFSIEASGGFPSGHMFPGLPLTFSPQAPPLVATAGMNIQPNVGTVGGIGGGGFTTAPISNTIVFSTDPHLSSTTTTTTGIAEVKLDGNKMTISTNVAPFKPEKLEVKAADNKITIRASGQEEKDPKTGYIKTKEFHRQYLIPMGCNPEKMKCSYDKGVLKIRVIIPERHEQVLPIEIEHPLSAKYSVPQNAPGTLGNPSQTFQQSKGPKFP